MDSKTRLNIFERANYMCENCYKVQGIEIHHIVANTKLNRKLYGDKIDCEENLILVCKDCHNKHTLWDMDKRKKLIEKWEFEKLNETF